MSTTKPTNRDSMKSTWRNDKSQWGFFHRIYNITSLHPDTPGVVAPKHQKTDAVPFISDWQTNKWIITHTAIPLLLHQAYIWYFGKNLGPIAATLFYSTAFKLIAIHELNVMRLMGQKYGFFDGDQHDRDNVPDHSVVRTFFSLVQTATYRPMMAVMLTYRASKTPADINWWWLPLEVGTYGIILDFWFYWYHRLMHEVDALWKFHRTHHLTKHPNPLLTLYADAEQEFWDIAGIPFLTWGTMRLMGMPMGFYEWWICYQYVVFTELFGHSGIRIYGAPAGTLSWLLTLTGTELVIEDHDLHHRRGWKKSGNYGKQTRLWDTIFGTCRDRIECSPQNIDYVNRVTLPLWGKP